jgi:hypothetical protein
VVDWETGDAAETQASALVASAIDAVLSDQSSEWWLAIDGHSLSHKQRSSSLIR